jgi:hypothetical protein
MMANVSNNSATGCRVTITDDVGVEQDHDFDIIRRLPSQLVNVPAPFSGSTVAIETITLASGGEFNFNSISPSYKRLFIRGKVYSVDANVGLEMQYNGVTTSYTRQRTIWADSSAGVNTVAAQAQIGFSAANTGPSPSNIDCTIEHPFEAAPTGAICKWFILDNGGANEMTRGEHQMWHRGTQIVEDIRIYNATTANGLTGELTLYGEL